MLPGARSLLSTRVMHTTKYSLAESRGQVKLGGLFLNQIYPRQCTVDKITVRVPRRHDNARWGVSREIAFGKKERKIPLITFLIFEEPDVPLKRGMGKSLIFEEPNPFRVY
jgi:hypothetical protein